jgi:hypothetical protein
MFSRNSASSRAIPIDKMLEKIETDPVIPVWWGKNQKGMQAQEALSPEEETEARAIWLLARSQAVGFAKTLRDQGVHKQLVNRVVEPWMWITVLVTATEFDNFFHLRCHPDAQPEIRHIAEMAKKLFDESQPHRIEAGWWHLPLVTDQDQLTMAGYAVEDLVKICVGRCARVSYLTHEGKRDPAADIGLHDRLAESGHLSPFEHPATALENPTAWSGNFQGWKQYRKTIAFEQDYLGRPKEIEIPEAFYR